MTGIREIGKPETDPTIVEYLESMLNRARAGEITSFACVAVLTSRRTIRQHVVGETGLRPFAAEMTISRAEFEAVPPMPDLAEQRYREMQAQIARDMLHRPDPQIAADIETINAELKFERDLLDFKVVRLPDGRLAKRCEDEPDKVLVLQRPASLADMLRDFPSINGRKAP